MRGVHVGQVGTSHMVMLPGNKRQGMADKPVQVRALHHAL